MGFFLHSICLARARTSELVAIRDQVFDKNVESWSKACRKPARTRGKPGCKLGRKPGLQPGLQLARIMECCLYHLATHTSPFILKVKGHTLGVGKRLYRVPSSLYLCYMVDCSVFFVVRHHSTADERY